MTEVTTSH